MMDNLYSHKAQDVRTWTENQEAELIYLPSYWPDLNASYAALDMTCSPTYLGAQIRNSPLRCIMLIMYNMPS
jgi:hypothetical protein